MENVMNKISIALSFILFITFIYGCSEDTLGPTNKNQLPEGIAGTTSFKYVYLETAPIHTQTSMLTGYQNGFYRIGSRWPIQVLDLVNNSWSEIQLPDSTFWRWDGAAVTIDDSIFIIATSSASNSYDILKLDLSTITLQHTNINLPSDFHYPAYCTFGDRIVFFSLKTDSIFEFNSEKSELKKVAENPFINIEDINQTLSSGKYLNYFYVFGGFSSLPKNLFYRLNLDNHLWEQLAMPAILENKQLIGASFGSNFLLFCDSLSTYEYSFIDNRWYLDTSKVPIYVRDLTGQLMQGEWSFSSEDSCLYGSENLSDKVWKISK